MITVSSGDTQSLPDVEGVPLSKVVITTKSNTSHTALSAAFSIDEMLFCSVACAAAPGDLNFDSVINGLDIDLLRHEIATMNGEARFDLNGDLVVNGDDVIHLITVILDTITADVNLDQRVDALDLAISR